MTTAILRASCAGLCGLLLWMLPATASAASDERAQTATVRQFVAAFNAKDIEAMLALSHADIEWLSISGSAISTETQGREALRASMQSYFKSCPSCRSQLKQLRSTSARVSALEIASWDGKDGRRSQSSLSVYEFEQGLIRRVYYFPAER